MPFDEEGYDRSTYAPFALQDLRSSEWKDVRLSFNDWSWLQSHLSGDTVDGYYLNGYGVQGLVQAALLIGGVDPDQDGIHYDSEGDTCYIHFIELTLATRAAELAAAMIREPAALERAIVVARDRGFED